MDNKRKALIAACSTLGINIENGTKLSLEQATELSKILKEEYGINAVIVSKEYEELKTSMKEFVFENKPALEFCGTPQDGKERRRERRRMERLATKNKRL